MINKLLGRNFKKKYVSKLIDDNGNITSSPHEVSNKFNEYFCNIAGDLKSKISSEVHSDHNYFEEYLGHPATESIRLTAVSQEEVDEIIKNFAFKHRNVPAAAAAKGEI